MAEGGRPRPAFFGTVLLVVVGLVALGLYRFGALDSVIGKPGGGGSSIELPAGAGVEAPDGQGITTVKEYNYVPGQRLPEVKGVSNYKPMAANTVRMALNVWAGWAPLIYANNGLKPGKVWNDGAGKAFKLELVLIDDPVAMRDAYAAGDIHIGWATLDMLPLMLDGLKKDSRTMPRVFQQVDFSNGGDGIVVRENIRTVTDLRGKTIVLAQNSPSQFFALNALIARDPFISLVSQHDGAPLVSHLPVLAERVAVADETGLRLRGHWARANPQWRSIVGQTALAIVHGHLNFRTYATSRIFPACANRFRQESPSPPSCVHCASILHRGAPPSDRGPGR